MVLTNVLIVGSGPAGIGIASLLDQTLTEYVVLDKKGIGGSFTDWPENMEMITPSFPSNAFGQMDLNSISEATSPGFSYRKEHLTGKEYARYLSAVVNYHELCVQTHTEVIKVNKQKNGWKVDTSQGQFFCKYIVWAAGEFQNPRIDNIKGAELCIHSAHIKTPDQLEGDDFVVIGGYESGVQLALEQVRKNKKVTLINAHKIDQRNTSDPSRVLSPYTHTKYLELQESELYTEVIGEVVAVQMHDDKYMVQFTDGSMIETETRPICATGFSLVTGPIEEFVTFREDGSPALYEETDEFLGHENIYLSGPSVRHDEHIFCFIYKFRQRFGVIVEDILRKEGYQKEHIEKLVNRWKANGLYLSDLSCCGDECVC